MTFTFRDRFCGESLLWFLGSARNPALWPLCWDWDAGNHQPKGSTGSLGFVPQWKVKVSLLCSALAQSGSGRGSVSWSLHLCLMNFHEAHLEEAPRAISTQGFPAISLQFMLKGRSLSEHSLPVSTHFDLTCF